MGITYTILKSICESIMNLYFSKVVIIGKENIPQTGPLILCGNHSNQFIDAMMILTKVDRKITFTMAASSYNKPVIGDFAKLLNVIPVMRPEDYKIKAKGKIRFVNSKEIEGINTNFVEDTKPYVGFGLWVANRLFVVDKVIDDKTIKIRENTEISKIPEGELDYSIVPKMDNTTLFSSVYQRLKDNGCICIFPEGTSHDRTDFIKLKAGIALMALGAMSEYGTENVKIVPVGLNYFSRDKFRSKVMIEFGKAFEVPKSWSEEFKTNKKEATEKLLKEIEARMKSVTLTAPSYIDLRSIYFMRKLYVPPDTVLLPAQYAELCKRFHKGWDKIKDDPELKKKITSVHDYIRELEDVGLTDTEVKEINNSFYWLFQESILAILKYQAILLLSLPGWIFLPFAKIIKSKAEKERVAAKNKNPNKILGLDVVSSVKVTYSIMLFPFVLTAWCMLWFIFFKILLKVEISTSKLIGIALIVYPFYFKFLCSAFDYIKFFTAILYSRFVYFLFPEKIYLLRKHRQELVKIVHDYINAHIDEIDPTYKQDRIIISEPVKNEEEFIQRRNSLRKLSNQGSLEVDEVFKNLK